MADHHYEQLLLRQHMGSTEGMWSVSQTGYGALGHHPVPELAGLVVADLN